MPKCSHCSAPLPRDGCVCGYCGAANDVDLTGVTETTAPATVSCRTCPRCAQPLTTVTLALEPHVFIERCERCFGIFFDNGELELVLGKTVMPASEIDHAKMKELLHHTRDSYISLEYAKCPVCAEFMYRTNYGARSGIIVDRCRAHGVWLDGGELKKIVEWKKAGGAIIEERRAVRRQAEKRKAREAYTDGVRAYAAESGARDATGSELFPEAGDATLGAAIKKIIGMLLM